MAWGLTVTDTGKFRLSPEARALLREHTDFFAPLVEVHQLAEVPLRIQGKDAEARTETKVLPNGDREVVWIYPIDDNADPGDGRLYLRDSFSFDPSERVLKNFRREIDGAAGLSGEWENYLKQHRLAVAAAAWRVGDPRVEGFARQVATGFSRPMVGEDGALSDALHEAFFRQADYLRRAGDLARRWRPDWKLKAGDPQSHYVLIPRGRELEILLTLAVDVDGDPEQDRIFLRERFLVDTASGALVRN